MDPLFSFRFNHAGFGSGEAIEWMYIGGSDLRLASEFWFIRRYAADRQEPLMQQALFLRFDWQDIIPSKLNAGGVFFISPRDGSLLAQLSAQYFISKFWTVGLFLGGTFGGTDMVYGSRSWSTSAVLQMVRYL
jgi:hypothetical protein